MVKVQSSRFRVRIPKFISLDGNLELIFALTDNAVRLDQSYLFTVSGFPVLGFPTVNL